MAASAERPVSSEEMAVIEFNAVALGTGLDTLMENAGRAVAEESLRHLPPSPARVGVVCGTGNNGGDGFCAAFYLGQWGYSPDVWVVRPPAEIRAGPARLCFERIARRMPIHARLPTSAELRDLPLALDAMLGTGQRGDLRPPYSDAVSALIMSRVPVLSIDVPTGLGSSRSVRPSWTVTLTATKEGMTPENAGTITVRDIGIPPEARWRSGPGDFLDFPVASGRSNRGRTGRLLIVGGGPYAGAPALAGLAALRSGAERATVVAPRPASDRVQDFSPNLVVHSVGEEQFQRRDVPSIREFLRRTPAKAVVVGMGAGSNPETREALAELVDSLAGTVPLVVDADALAALDGRARAVANRSGSEIVATPNQGEFARVFHGRTDGEWEDRVASARHIAEDWRLTLLIKGEVDIISDGIETYTNHHHTAAMTVGGLGDVLAGVVGSLLAQGVDPVRAGRLATYWVGEAGSRVADTRGPGLVATDVIDELPATLVEGLRRVRPVV
ncbi:MAG: NAD(P)H-hydrate dehydratase [Thermoplasmata archaeon]